VRIVASSCVTLAFCLVVSWAQAQQRSTTFSLTYSVPAGCPERDAFVRSLLSRARGAHVQSEAPQVALAVQLDGERDLTPGTLVIKLLDGQESHREIPAAACAQVLSSMALIAAMILDGGGLDDPPPSASAEPARDVPPPSPPHPRLAPTAQRSVRTEPGGDAAAKREGQLRLALAAAIGAQSGVAPDPVPRFFAGLGLVFERPGPWSPSLDVAASFTTTAREVTNYGDARFRLLTLTLTACPLRFALGTRVGLRPCLPLDFGVLRGKGENTLAERDQSMPWLGAGAALRAEMSVSRAWLVELQGGATVLARADRFVFEPDSVAHDVPRVVFGLRLGAALRVP
jgi:hypothetical protein